MAGVAADADLPTRVGATLLDERGFTGSAREWYVLAMRRVMSTHISCLLLHAALPRFAIGWCIEVQNTPIEKLEAFSWQNFLKVEVDEKMNRALISLLADRTGLPTLPDPSATAKKGFGGSNTKFKRVVNQTEYDLAWCINTYDFLNAITSLSAGFPSASFHVFLPDLLFIEHDVFEANIQLNWSGSEIADVLPRSVFIPGAAFTKKIAGIVRHSSKEDIFQLRPWLQVRLFSTILTCIRSGNRDAGRRLAAMMLEGIPEIDRVMRFSRAGDAAVRVLPGERLVLLLPLSPDGSLPDPAAALGWLDAAKRAGRAGGAASLLVLGVAGQQDVTLHPTAETVASECLAGLMERHEAAEATRTARAEAARAASSAVFAAARTRDAAALEAASLTHYGGMRAAADGAAVLAACWRTEDAVARFTSSGCHRRRARSRGGVIRG